MGPVRWICFLLGTVLIQKTQGLLFGKHHEQHEHQEHHDSSEEYIPNDPYRSPLKPEYFCQGPCMDGWTSYMGQCHMYVAEKRTWEEAGKYCKKVYGKAYLTSILNEEHNSFLMTLAKYVNRNGGIFWTGASDMKGNVKFTLENLTGFLWNKVCKSLGILGLGILGETNCNTRLPFVCMYKPKIFP
ncbi:lectin-like [Pleurodeles waltl]|uniref:lectin-like n=1 Tax=Pleurodeles waltl TaxID=8319 RepID=UPI0037093CAF